MSASASVQDSPWILRTSSPDDPKHRDAFLGNGWMGQRFGIDGDAGTPLANVGDPCAPGGCLIHGLWDDTGLMPPPKWAVLGYHDGKALFKKGAGSWRDYSQELDMRTATLSTGLVWDSGAGRTTRISSAAYLSRSRPNLAVIERELTPSFDGVIQIIDSLDGSFATDAKDWRVKGDAGQRDLISLDLKMGPAERRLSLVSRLLIEGPEPDISISRSERGVERTVRLKLSAGQTCRIRKFVAIVSDAESASPWTTAWNLVEGAAREPEKLRAEHLAAWGELWESRIETGSLEVSKTLNASLFQLYSHLREGSPWIPGPTGLSGNAWRGHAFWDDDLWMFPPLCLLRPELGRCFADYRRRTLPGAIRNAKAEGYDGAMIAWESAETGDDTIPHLIYHRQHHVNSDVALAQWWFLLISGEDENSFRDNGGLAVILECARFWASRAVFVKEKDRYEILGVCCADEFAGIKDNNAYTNYSAAWTLRLAAKISRSFGLEAPPSWEEIANKLWTPFDEKAKRFLEYEGYAGQTIKQADAALLVYPYEMPMSDEIKANTVDYYRERYPEGNIMMASAFDGIVDCELKRPAKAWESFRNMRPHFRGPFLLVSESPLNECISFATGLGGLLQLVLMGFCGIRIREDGLVVEPCVPEELGSISVRGLHYGGVSFDLEIEGGEARISGLSKPPAFSIRNRAGKSWL